MKSADYRRKAREKLAGNWGTMAIIALIEGVILGALSATFVGTLIVSGPLMLGILACSLALVRNQNIDIQDMFKGFGNFVSSFVLYLINTILTALWSLLFVIPGIIAMINYSMSYFILQDNPNMTGNEARKASIAMMKGHKMELFLLALSFIGWFILSVLTFGILFLWTIPYYRTAKAEFYENIKSSQVSAN